MKRILCVLLCVVTCLACSLTAFAGGPITAEDALAAKSKGDVAEPYWLSRELTMGVTYKIKSMASTTDNYMLNVSGTNVNIAINNTTSNVISQKFWIISSGSYNKLVPVCGSGKVLDA